MSALRGLVDLAAARVGGKALVANDEFFAPKSNLLKAGPAVSIKGKFTDRGNWMDGWESRRKRGPGHDWCIVRLGIPGVIRALTVDTSHFTGNYPESCSVDGAVIRGKPTPARVAAAGDWKEVLPRSPLQGHTANEFTVSRGDTRFTHVRLNIFPDGGVARLRIWGEARPDWSRLVASKKPLDLVAAVNGGAPLDSSDEFYGRPINLIMPDRPANMDDGWETRRRRGPGHDWTILKLGHAGVIERVELDTTHFKGNYPESASIDGSAVLPEAGEWREILPRTKLFPNKAHKFKAPSGGTPVRYVRLNMFPDGGIARLRLFGRPA
ncbi:MAG: allantoicase [Gemmatimonadetes bacterium]|nr:allantoicase [Gemmatimonadota bacterium]